jgi:pyrroline-5-carboxylate reductase
MTLEEIIARVATRGGITEEGVHAFHEGLPQTFNDMFTRTLNKRTKVDAAANADFVS